MNDLDGARALAAAWFEALGRWVPTEPDPEIKLLFARHSLTVGTHVVALDRAGARPGATAAALDRATHATGTRGRLEAAYREGLPVLGAAYAAAGVPDDLRADVDRTLAEGEGALGRSS